jgi:hypothetical protein
MDIDAALMAGAIAGGITGGIVAAVISLGVVRSQRHLGGTSIGAAKPTTEWRAPSGPLARHLAHTEAPTPEAPDRPTQE